MTNVINTITGDAPFRSYPYELQLTDELQCPKCDTDSDCNSYFNSNAS